MNHVHTNANYYAHTKRAILSVLDVRKAARFVTYTHVYVCVCVYVQTHVRTFHHHYVRHHRHTHVL